MKNWPVFVYLFLSFVGAVYFREALETFLACVGTLGIVALMVYHYANDKGKLY